MKNILFVFVLCCAVLAFAFASPDKKKDEIKLKKLKIADAKLVDEVERIFAQSCATGGCHKGQYPKKRLNLETDKYFDAIVGKPSLQIDSLKLVEKGDPAKSYLYMKVAGTPGIIEQKMPVDAPALTQPEIAAIEKWIISLGSTPTIREKPEENHESKKKTSVKAK